MKTEIINNGTTEFPFYTVMVNSEEYCSTGDIKKAENLVKLLSIGVVSNCADDLEYSLYGQVVNLKEKVKTLEFMIENGLGEEDMINDITYPSGD